MSGGLAKEIAPLVRSLAQLDTAQIAAGVPTSRALRVSRVELHAAFRVVRKTQGRWFFGLIAGRTQMDTQTDLEARVVLSARLSERSSPPLLTCTPTLIEWWDANVAILTLRDRFVHVSVKEPRVYSDGAHISAHGRVLSELIAALGRWRRGESGTALRRLRAAGASERAALVAELNEDLSAVESSVIDAAGVRLGFDELRLALRVPLDARGEVAARGSVRHAVELSMGSCEGARVLEPQLIDVLVGEEAGRLAAIISSSDDGVARLRKALLRGFADVAPELSISDELVRSAVRASTTTFLRTSWRAPTYLMRIETVVEGHTLRALIQVRIDGDDMHGRGGVMFAQLGETVGRAPLARRAKTHLDSQVGLLLSLFPMPLGS